MEAREQGETVGVAIVSNGRKRGILRTRSGRDDRAWEAIMRSALVRNDCRKMISPYSHCQRKRGVDVRKRRANI
jgi:hypothetical protein